jgi:hypothetical protein
MVLKKMQTIHKQALDNLSLSYACLLSTNVVNKQASISCIARDRRQDRSQFCPFRANKQGK